MLLHQFLNGQKVHTVLLGVQRWRPRSSCCLKCLKFSHQPGILPVQVFGIVGGFAGFWDENQPPVELTVKDVELIQHEGGSILG